MNRFWEIIYDDSKRTMDAVGSANDILFTNNVAEMQRSGMQVHCQAGEIAVPKENLKLPGYTFEDNLYSRLLNEYEQKTCKQLKRW